MDLFTRAFIVNLNDRYAVERRLLGKHLKFHSSDECIMTIVIPALVRKGDRVVMSMPGLLDRYGIDLDDWGGWNRCVSVDDVKTYDAWISSILIECTSDKKEAIPDCSEIQKKGNCLIHALHIINPDAICKDSDKQSTDLCEISSEVMLKSGERPQSVIHISFSMDDKKGQVSFVDIKHAIRNYNKPVSVPYEMVDNARMNLSRQDTRSAVLHCATAIEFVLKKLVIAYLDAKVSDNSLKDFVLRQADGYSRLVELCKRCSISLAGLPNVKETVVDIRNRVIHGGYVPLRQEANKAYEDTRQALAVLKTPMFE